MSDAGSSPPPHATPPGPPPPGSSPADPPRPGATQPGGLPQGAAPRGAAHKPGAIALRPLRLGDIYDGTFRIIRYNPRATVGAALLVSLVAMSLPIVVGLVAGLTGDATLDDLSSQTGPTTAELTSVLSAFGAFTLGAVGLQVGTILVTGVIAHVTHAAAVGRKLGLAEAWAATRGTRWRLVGLSFLSFLAFLLLPAAITVVALALLALDVAGGAVIAVAVLLGIAAVPVAAWFYVRVFYLAPAAVALERAGVLGSLGRARGLSRSQFWRLLGIALLTGLLVGIAGLVLSIPLTLLGEVLMVTLPQYAAPTSLIVQSLSTVVTSAFTVPLVAGVTTVQYLDQRIRKEAYDVELMRQAGVTGL